jgi:hypothetical protein
MKKLFLIVIITIFLLAACDDADKADSGSRLTDSEPLTIAYSASGPELSRLLGRQWAKSNTDFVWTFENDGTVTVIHCCGEEFKKQFSYLLCGNILVTYGSEEFSDEIEAGTLTMTGTSSDLSFTRYNGISFTQVAEPVTTPASSLSLSNELLGTWQGEDGTKYEFSSDSGLKIISPSGDSGQYRYLVRYSVFLTLGPLVDGTEAVLKEYRFNRKGDKVYMSLDGVKSTLSLLE